MASFPLKNSLSVQRGLGFGFSVLALALLGACGSDDGSDPQRGTAVKGETCAEDVDCASELARCNSQSECTGELTRAALQTECTRETANACAGFGCLVPGENVQGKTGLCSYKCTTNADCGEGVCVNLPGAGDVCLSPCNDNSQCTNGFVCVTDPAGTGKACFVEPVAG